MLVGFVEALEAMRPDMVLVLGDRGEMLAGALAAIHLNIPVVHIHGGERSGTVDEPVRHAISKLAHFHFVATDESRERLVRMGEAADRVFVVGAPGLDGLKETALTRTRGALCRGWLRSETARSAPRLSSGAAGGRSLGAGYCDHRRALRARDAQVMALKPNSDAGSTRRARRSGGTRRGRRTFTWRPIFRAPEFLSWLAACDVIVGNSSSGIIEAASFGTPVVNVGSRQNLRQRNANIFDCSVQRADLDSAITHALASPRFDGYNVYGDGKAGERIAALLTRIDPTVGSMAKTNVY